MPLEDLAGSYTLADEITWRASISDCWILNTIIQGRMRVEFKQQPW
jgi:hypothetical protein